MASRKKHNFLNLLTITATAMSVSAPFFCNSCSLKTRFSILGNDCLVIGDQHDFKVSNNDDVVWSINDGKVATIDPNTGHIIPLKSGTAVVTATSKNNPNNFTAKEIKIINDEVKDFVTDDWALIVHYANMGFEKLKQAYKDTKSFIDNKNSFVGLQKEIKINQKIHIIRVIDENRDVLFNDSSKKAALTMQFVTALSSSNGRAIKKAFNIKYWFTNEINYWYNPDTKKNSDIRNYLSYDVRLLICEGLGISPSEFPIKTVKKKYIKGAGSPDVLDNSEDVFLICCSEMLSKEAITNFGQEDKCPIFNSADIYNSESDSQYKWYADHFSTQKIDIYDGRFLSYDASGRVTDWYFRDPCMWFIDGKYKTDIVVSTNANYEETGVFWGDANPSAARGMMPCFCL